MAASKSLTFELFGKDKSASSTMDKVGKSASANGERFKKAGVAIGIGMAAVGAAAVKFGMDSVAAYADAEASQAKLALAYQKFPALLDGNQKDLQRLNSVLQKKSRFDDDQIAAAQAQLAQYGLTTAELKTLTPLMLDYAIATGKDVTSASTDLGKAMLGNGKALKNIGVDFKDTGSAAGNFQQLVEGLTAKVQGLSRVDAGTAAGKLEMLKNQFGEIQEKVGEKLTPALLTLADVTTSKVLPALDDLANSKGIDEFFESIEKHSKSGDLFGFMDPEAQIHGLQQIKDWLNNGEVDPAGSGGPFDPVAWQNGWDQFSAFWSVGAANGEAQINTWWAQVGAASGNGLAQIGAYFGQIGPMFESSVASWGGAFANGGAQIASFFNGVATTITTWQVNAFGQMTAVGRNMMDGLTNGIVSNVAKAISSIRKVGTDMLNGIKDILGIHSPSREFAKVGAQIGAGLVSGIAGSAGAVSGAVNRLVTIPDVSVSASSSLAGGGAGGARAPMINNFYSTPIRDNDPYTTATIMGREFGRAVAG